MAHNEQKQEHEVLTYPVPDGFPAMSMPCDPSSRLVLNKDFVLSKAEERDLVPFAAGIHASFPELWWGRHEPVDRRPSQDERRRRLAKRMHYALTWPDFDFVVAKTADTGELMGVAGWHRPVGADKGFYVPGVLDRTTLQNMKVAETEGWGADEERKVWSAVVTEEWDKEFRGYDKDRRELMEGEPHWYLAPLFVIEKYRGRGVGRELLHWALDQADAQSPPVTCYLEALPNARPVYMHEGFKGVEGKGMVMIRRKAAVNGS